MDDFAFDLDKALDELEEKEDKDDSLKTKSCGPQPSLGPSAPPDLSDYYNYPTVTNGTGHAPYGHTLNGSMHYTLPYTRLEEEPYEPPVNLDLDDADFAPSLSSVQPVSAPPDITPSISGAQLSEHAVVTPALGDVPAVTGSGELNGASIPPHVNMQATNNVSEKQNDFVSSEPNGGAQQNLSHMDYSFDGARTKQYVVDEIGVDDFKINKVEETQSFSENAGGSVEHCLSEKTEAESTPEQMDISRGETPKEPESLVIPSETPASSDQTIAPPQEPSPMTTEDKSDTEDSNASSPTRNISNNISQDLDYMDSQNLNPRIETDSEAKLLPCTEDHNILHVSGMGSKNQLISKEIETTSNNFENENNSTLDSHPSDETTKGLPQNPCQTGSINECHPQVSDEIPEEMDVTLPRGASGSKLDSPQADSGASSGGMSSPEDVVGFPNNADLDVSDSEMEKYLSTIGGPDNVTEYDAKPSFGDDIGTESLHKNQIETVKNPDSITGVTEDELNPDQLTVPDDDLGERRGSSESIEKFLVPTVMSPGIATPIEDPGYSKVPGYVPEQIATIAEEGEDESEEQESAKDNTNKPNTDNPAAVPSPRPVDQTITSPVEISGARPKEPLLPVKISRPRSLLGLSTPDLPSSNNAGMPQFPMPSGIAGEIGARDSGIVEDFRPPSVEESMDIPESSNTYQEDMDGARNIHDRINMQLAAQKTAPLMKLQLNLEIKQKLDQEQTTFSDNRNQEPDSQSEIPSEGGNIALQQPSDMGPSDINNTPQSMDEAQVLDPNSSPRQKRPNSLNFAPRRVAPHVAIAEESTPSPGVIPDSAEVTPSGESPGSPEDGNVGSGEAAMSETQPAHSVELSEEDPYLQQQIGASGPLPVVSPIPPSSANINLAITQLGRVAPIWVPDSEASSCMQCDSRFTFTKRRHHCRACGKVFCNSCCNLRSSLHYMENKEARVCSKCYQDLIRAQVYERMHQPGLPSPNPNNPSEYCSTVPPLQQAVNAPPPTVMVPSGVLRKDGSLRRGEASSKQVMFSDGIRPGGDLTELDGSTSRIAPPRGGRKIRRIEKHDDKGPASGQVSRDQTKMVCLIPEQGLPPVLLSTGVKGDFSVEENPDAEQIMPRIRSTDDPEPVVFAINRNLFVMVKIVNLDCCVNRVCWCFSTKGMCTVSQDEIVIVLECLPDEKTIPRDIFCHMNAVYEEASKGNTVSNLGHTIFAQGFLDSRDHSGFLYVNATYQCLQKLILPPQPYIFGILLQKWETPWAKVFPIRLMLRLGAEYRYYPCPLISVRFRKPVFGEIGHTIMNLLADFRNYQYMLPQIPGVSVHMEDKQTFINFPKNRYSNVMKVLTASNDHVMALGSNFSLKADSHLVCIQNDDGSYQTQAINIQNKPRKVTGASFVVFNGAFKQSCGLRAKSSIVEDGLMVQITADMMAELKTAMRNMLDYTIGCGNLDEPEPEEVVTIRWGEDDHYVNMGVKSPIDSMSMEGVKSIRIHTATDFAGEKHTIRWTEVFFIKDAGDSNSRGDPVDLSRLAEGLAQAVCVAVVPLLDKLVEAHLTRLGLRATIDPEQVCYEVGSNGARLPDQYMDPLDNALIPIIHSAASQNQDGPVVLELIFHIIE